MDLRYPIGEFKYEKPLSDDERRANLAKIEETPARMRAAVAGLNEEQLDTAYRPEGRSEERRVGKCICRLGFSAESCGSLSG